MWKSTIYRNKIQKVKKCEKMFNLRVIKKALIFWSVKRNTIFSCKVTVQTEWELVKMRIWEEQSKQTKTHFTLGARKTCKEPQMWGAAARARLSGFLGWFDLHYMYVTGNLLNLFFGVQVKLSNRNAVRATPHFSSVILSWGIWLAWTNPLCLEQWKPWVLRDTALACVELTSNWR